MKKETIKIMRAIEGGVILTTGAVITAACLIEWAEKLWRRDPRTLIKWAKAGVVLSDRKPYGNNKVPWYIERPGDNYDRLNAR